MNWNNGHFPISGLCSEQNSYKQDVSQVSGFYNVPIVVFQVLVYMFELYGATVGCTRYESCVIRHVLLLSFMGLVQETRHVGSKIMIIKYTSMHADTI